MSSIFSKPSDITAGINSNILKDFPSDDTLIMTDRVYWSIPQDIIAPIKISQYGMQSGEVVCYTIIPQKLEIELVEISAGAINNDEILEGTGNAIMFILSCRATGVPQVSSNFGMVSHESFEYNMMNFTGYIDHTFIRNKGIFLMPDVFAAKDYLINYIQKEFKSRPTGWMKDFIYKSFEKCTEGQYPIKFKYCPELNTYNSNCNINPV